MSASTASADSHAATAPDASVPATAAPMDLKIPITGVVVLLLQGIMALGARGSTTFDLTASSDLFRLGAPGAQCPEEQTGQHGPQGAGAAQERHRDGVEADGAHDGLVHALLGA